MDSFTRRSFLVASAGAAGTAAVFVAPGLASAGETSSKSTTPSSKKAQKSHHADALANTVVSVRDPENGVVVIYSLDREIVVTSHDLCAAIADAAAGKD